MAGVRKRVAIPLLVFLVMAAIPPMIYHDYWQYSWWMLYEAIIHDRHRDRCVWPDDIILDANGTRVYDFEYDAELDCNLKPEPGGGLGMWYSETTERPYGNRTTSEYGTIYSDCTISMAKDGTGTDAVSFRLDMECGAERGIPDTYGNQTNRFHRMTVPADFGVSWPDTDRCDMSLERSVYDNNITDVDTRVLITCWQD